MANQFLLYLFLYFLVEISANRSGNTGQLVIPVQAEVPLRQGCQDCEFSTSHNNTRACMFIVETQFQSCVTFRLFEVQVCMERWRQYADGYSQWDVGGHSTSLRSRLSVQDASSGVSLAVNKNLYFLLKMILSFASITCQRVSL